MKKPVETLLIKVLKDTKDYRGTKLVGRVFKAERRGTLYLVRITEQENLYLHVSNCTVVTKRPFAVLFGMWQVCLWTLGVAWHNTYMDECFEEAVRLNYDPAVVYGDFNVRGVIRPCCNKDGVFWLRFPRFKHLL